MLPRGWQAQVPIAAPIACWQSIHPQHSTSRMHVSPARLHTQWPSVQSTVPQHSVLLVQVICVSVVVSAG